MLDAQPFPTPEQRQAMEKRCRWLMKTRKILELRLAECTHEEDGKTAGYDERVFDLLLDCQEEDYLLRFLKPRRGPEPRSREEEERIRRFWEEEKRRAEADVGQLGLTEQDVWALRPDHEDEGSDGGVLSLKDAIAELLRGMTRWKGAWAIATLLSIYTELSTFFHNIRGARQTHLSAASSETRDETSQGCSPPRISRPAWRHWKKRWQSSSG